MKVDKNSKVVLANSCIILEPANEENVDTLINWTLDPVAQGPFKMVPKSTIEELRELFLHSKDRSYFLIRDNLNEPVGRFYYRAWDFGNPLSKIDWELNIFIADPLMRGKGHGTAAQTLAVEHLCSLNETNSVFAFTMIDNIPEQKSLEKVGFKKLRTLPSDYYRVDAELEHPEDFYLYVYEVHR